MNYELARELDEAGFPQGGAGSWAYPTDKLVTRSTDRVYVPTLEELLEACGDELIVLARGDDGNAWKATGGAIPHEVGGVGVGPAEAVARLWLALNNKV
jgi:hypothetical protein